MSDKTIAIALHDCESDKNGNCPFYNIPFAACLSVQNLARKERIQELEAALRGEFDDTAVYRSMSEGKRLVVQYKALVEKQKARIGELEEALRDIAKQKTVDELESDGDEPEDLDIDSAYDFIIGIARAVLEKEKK